MVPASLLVLLTTTCAASGPSGLLRGGTGQAQQGGAGTEVYPLPRVLAQVPPPASGVEWVVGAQGDSCTYTCGTTGRLCDLDALQGIDSAGKMASTMEAAGRSCFSTTSFNFPDDPSASGCLQSASGSCQYMCSYTRGSTASCDASNWARRRLCPCARRTTATPAGAVDTTRAVASTSGAAATTTGAASASEGTTAHGAAIPGAAGNSTGSESMTSGGGGFPVTPVVVGIALALLLPLIAWAVHRCRVARKDGSGHSEEEECALQALARCRQAWGWLVAALAAVVAPCFAREGHATETARELPSEPAQEPPCRACLRSFLWRCAQAWAWLAAALAAAVAWLAAAVAPCCGKGEPVPEPPQEDGKRQEFDFILAEHLVKLDKMPVWKEARANGWLVRRTVFFHDVARGGLREDTLVVSHRWVESGHPDPRGAQMRKVKQYLQEHPEIKEVWIDFSCLPQGKRNASEKQFFKSCLKAANMLYLGSNILIVVDAAYCARFWTQFECFLSMRTIQRSGLEPETGRSRAHFAGDGQYEEDASLVVQDLQRRWGLCSVEEAYEMLAKDDVAVTNQGDKELQLKKLMELETKIQHLQSEGGEAEAEGECTLM